MFCTKNRSHHSAINRSPHYHEVLFGSKPNVQLGSTNIPMDILQEEGDLEEFTEQQSDES